MPEHQTYWYLATPYSKYPAGLEAAFNLALDTTALLVKAGVPVFSPIAHTHPVALRAGMDPHDHAIWLPCDKPLIDAASGLVMVMAESWETSYGMKVEREMFEAAGKPVVWMTPGVLPEELRQRSTRSTVPDSDVRLHRAEDYTRDVLRIMGQHEDADNPVMVREIAQKVLLTLSGRKLPR